MTKKEIFYWYAYRDTGFLNAVAQDMNAANASPYSIDLSIDELWEIGTELNTLVKVNGQHLTVFELIYIIAHVSVLVGGGTVVDAAKAGIPPPPPPPFNTIDSKRQVPLP